MTDFTWQNSLPKVFWNFGFSTIQNVLHGGGILPLRGKLNGGRILLLRRKLNGARKLPLIVCCELNLAPYFFWWNFSTKSIFMCQSSLEYTWWNLRVEFNLMRWSIGGRIPPLMNVVSWIRSPIIWHIMSMLL